jgi:hypothetical protein
MDVGGGWHVPVMQDNTSQNDLVLALRQVPLVPELAEQLLRAGADADRAVLGDTPLTALLKNESASEQTAERIVMALLRSLGDNVARRRLCVNATPGGDLPLNLAAGRNFPRVCGILIEAGADTTLSDRSLRTPIETAVVNNAFETLNLLWSRPIKLATAFGSGAASKVRQQILGLAAALPLSKTVSLRASLDPDIRDERFLQKLAAKYITKPSDPVFFAPWCFHGDLLQQLQEPPKKTGRVVFACMEVELPEPIQGRSVLRLFWYEWAAMLIALAFDINYKIPSADMFSRKQHAEAWEELPHGVMPVRSYADTTGAAFRGDATIPEFAAGILQRLGRDRIGSHLAMIMNRGIWIGCSERGNEGGIGGEPLFASAEQQRPEKRFTCVLLCDEAYHSFIRYASTVSVSADIYFENNRFIHAEIAELNNQLGDKSTVTMYESNFRGMQGMHSALLREEPCGDDRDGGWCQTWAALFSEERLFRGRRWTAALVGAYRTLLDTDEETPFYVQFKRIFGDADGRCELTRFVRCLVLRYFDAQRKLIEGAGQVAPVQ